MRLLHRAVCMGTGVVGGWHLVAPMLAWSSQALGIMSGSCVRPAGLSGDLLHLPVFCWPCTVHFSLALPHPSGCCAVAQPWTWCQEVTLVLVLVLVLEMLSSSKGCRWQGAGCAALCVLWPILLTPQK